MACCKRWAAALIVALSCILESVPAQATASATHQPLFSTHAASLDDLLPKSTQGQDTRVLDVKAPNGKDGFSFPGGWPDDEYTFYAVAGKARHPVHVEAFVNPYLMWSPYSSAAFVVYSDSGASGGYHALLVSFDKGAVQVSEPTKEIGRDFFAYFERLGLTCEGGGEKKFGIGTNFFPIRWFDSSHALIAAEITPMSICDCYASFRAYKVELPSGKILQALDQAQVKKEFAADLGRLLAGAPNDNWDHDPKSCKPRPK
jgi:hypothetical protein